METKNLSSQAAQSGVRGLNCSSMLSEELRSRRKERVEDTNILILQRGQLRGTVCIEIFKNEVIGNLGFPSK